MISLNFEIKENKIKETTNSYVTTGSFKQVECDFTFNSAWDELVKTAIFTMNNVSYKVGLNDDKCYVPSEVLENDGDLYIGVFGTKVSGTELDKRLTTDLYKIQVYKGSFIDGETVTDPDVSIWEQYLNEVTALTVETRQLKSDTQTIYNNTENIAVSTPYIGTNGNWYVWNKTAGAYQDSGNKAQGTIVYEQLTDYATYIARKTAGTLVTDTVYYWGI